jgi:phage-related tail fiber protein
MANIVEEREFKTAIYEIAEDDDVVGGPGGISNRQATQLAARTNYLKDHVDDLENGDKAAGKASKLATARKISLSGDIAGSVSFDGSGDVEIAVKYKTSGVEVGTYRQVTVDAKGNVTGGSNPTTLAGYGITDAAPLNSPNFTDEPTAPTPDQFDSSKRIATMEALRTAGLQASTQHYVNATGNLPASYAGSTVIFTGITTFTVGVPLSKSVKIGSIISFVNTNSVPISIIRQGGDSIVFTATQILTAFLLYPGDTLVLQADGSATWTQIAGSCPIDYVRSRHQIALASRLPNTNYTNSTGKVITVNALFQHTSAFHASLFATNYINAGDYIPAANAPYGTRAQIHVLPGEVYGWTYNGSLVVPNLQGWVETY